MKSRGQTTVEVRSLWSARHGNRYVQAVSAGETLARYLLSYVVVYMVMSYTVQALYPATLATIDVVIGSGFLYLRGLSPVGLLMTVLGVIVVCQVLYTMASQVDSAVHQVVGRSEGSERRPSG